jgi:hypothetical protein
MFAGHFGLAAMVKSRERQVPLWALMVATQLLDIMFLVLVPLGVEGFRSVPGTSGGYGNFIFTADYTHSLVGALGISVAAMLVTMIWWGRRNGLIIGAVVFSHWILDLLVHRGDLPVLPGNAGSLPRLGLGLWNVPWLSVGLELVLVLAGAYLYYHAAMQTAIRAERMQTRQASTATATTATVITATTTATIPAPAPVSYRRRAVVASVVMFVCLLGLLLGDVLGV